mmetsp:Transcript_21397/g.62515  ORF Transcript_21397/g.62515 Transcript_21397/m.62515 type:complete len:447 (+) Transcript_21397:7838-9178(+)
MRFPRQRPPPGLAVERLFLDGVAETLDRNGGGAIVVGLLLLLLAGRQLVNVRGGRRRPGAMTGRSLPPPHGDPGLEDPPTEPARLLPRRLERQHLVPTVHECDGVLLGQFLDGGGVRAAPLLGRRQAPSSSSVRLVELDEGPPGLLLERTKDRQVLLLPLLVIVVAVEPSPPRGKGGVPSSASSSSSSSASMIKFAQEELLSHSGAYARLLKDQVQKVVAEWCGTVDFTVAPARAHLHLCVLLAQYFTLEEQYELDSSSFSRAESEDRMEGHLLGPIRECRMAREVRKGKCDGEVALIVAEEMAGRVAGAVLGTIVSRRKRFTDWGALLLAKQSRALQDMFCAMVLEGESGGGGGGKEDDDGHAAADSAGAGGAAVNTAGILGQFERLNQAVAILQLEKPSDWSAFAYRVGEGAERNLTAEEIRRVMLLRVDFSADAVTAVCGGNG